MNQNKYFVHPSAIVETKKIGAGTRIWAFVHILKNVVIGKNCNICDHCFIEDGVIIGDNVTLKSGIYIWSGVSVESNVFLGPNVVFTNDIRPRSGQHIEPVKTIIKSGASIGANSTILAGVSIGKNAMTGIGSVITRAIPDHALVYGNPAKQNGWVDESGVKLLKTKNKKWISPEGDQYVETEAGLKKLI
jgi:acetyltransferase-like isoleucine patch superfamily enzyme